MKAICRRTCTPLVLARAKEKLAYMTRAVFICGGHGPTAAQALQIPYSCLTQHINRPLLRARALGGSNMELPRRRHWRRVRPVNLQLFARIEPLQQHMHDWEARHIQRALRQTGGNKCAASRALGMSPDALRHIITKRHPNLDDPRPARRRSQREHERWWRAMFLLFRLMSACAMLGIPLVRLPIAPALRYEEVAA